MANIRVSISDQSLAVTKQADVPDDAPMSRLVPALVTKLGLPAGQYNLLCKRLGRHLTDNETLAGASVQQNDELRLVPTIQGAGESRRE